MVSDNMASFTRFTGLPVSGRQDRQVDIASGVAFTWRIRISHDGTGGSSASAA